MAEGNNKNRSKGNKRWYDSNPRLALLLNLLKNKEPISREEIINELKEIIVKYDEGLIDRHVSEFPMSEKRRWYDRNPYSWLVINTIKYADSILTERIVRHLNKRLLQENKEKSR